MSYKLVVQLQGRLGNQLFEIAAGHHYAKKNGMKFFIRESDAIRWPGFDVNPPNCYNRYQDLVLSRFDIDTLEEGFRGVKIEENKHQDFIRIPDGISSDIYMYGIWQSADYFPDFAQVRDLFKMPDDFRDQLMSKYDFENSVGISIRRGDYLKFKSDVVIPLMSWYIRVCQSMFKGMKFIISSDSIEWCKQNFTLPNATFIDDGAEKNLWTLSLCKHHIVSNSTFSWWTAFLNEQPDSITAYPSRFWVKPNLFFRDNFFLKSWKPVSISESEYEK